MSEPEALVVLRAANSRLTDAGSARFIYGVTKGLQMLGHDAVSATGITDFRSLETRTTQRTIAAAVIAESTTSIKTTSSPVLKLLGTPALWAMRSRRATEPRDRFHSEGKEWIFDADRGWQPTSPRQPARPGFRDALDPILPLEALNAITGISACEPAAEIRGTPTTKIAGTADTTLIPERFYQVPRFDEKYAREWLSHTPIVAWADQDALVHRLSWAPLPPDVGSDPLWRTIELYDFGAQLDRPTLTQ